MVVNMVETVEIVCTSRDRLLVVTLNGWPLGLMCMALIGYLTKHWRTYVLCVCVCVSMYHKLQHNILRYHICLSIIAALLLPLIYVYLDESARWLTQHGRTEEAHKVLQHMAKVRVCVCVDLFFNCCIYYKNPPLTDERETASQAGNRPRSSCSGTTRSTR
jgi:hypothetical protein